MSASYCVLRSMSTSIFHGLGGCSMAGALNTDEERGSLLFCSRRRSCGNFLSIACTSVSANKTGTCGRQMIMTDAMVNTDPTVGWILMMRFSCSFFSMLAVWFGDFPIVYRHTNFILPSSQLPESWHYIFVFRCGHEPGRNSWEDRAMFPVGGHLFARCLGRLLVIDRCRGSRFRYLLSHFALFYFRSAVLSGLLSIGSGWTMRC